MSKVTAGANGRSSEGRGRKMTPKEYRSLRESLNLTQGELAELVGVALNTISRRELGQIAIDREAELALGWIAEARKKKNGRKRDPRSI
jgi:transcriptional regulator with XRE-family HTH domain